MVWRTTQWPISTSHASISYAPVGSDSKAEDSLIIEGIGLDSRLIQGGDISVLNLHEGVWLEPGNNGNIGLVGTNTVIAGHRFQYLPPNTSTFYHLDKVKLGELVILYWQGERQVYEVTGIREVWPHQVEIRDAREGEALLTLYTCTPIGSNDRRLVVTSRRVYD